MNTVAVGVFQMERRPKLLIGLDPMILLDRKPISSLSARNVWKFRFFKANGEISLPDLGLS